MQLVFAIGFIAAAIVQLYACATERLVLRRATKGLIVALLLGLYVASSPAIRLPVVLALAFCLLGDLLLIRIDWLQLGGLAFFTGHLMYIMSFVQFIRFGAVGWTRYLAIAAGYALVVFVMLQYLWPVLKGSIRRAAAGYLCVVAVMNYFAALQLATNPSTGALLVFAGALLFLGSDFALLVRNFHTQAKLPAKRIIVMSSYIAAQGLIVAGILMMEGAVLW